MTQPRFITLRTAAFLTVPLLLLAAACGGQEPTAAAPEAAAPASAASTYTPSPSATPTPTPTPTEPEEPEDITEARITVCNHLNGDTESDEWTEYECDRVSDQLDAPTYEPKKKDWKVTIKVREKKCFGSAGCNVTYRIDPEFVGDESLPDTGEIEVFYKVTGAEDPIENYFTVDSDGSANFDSEETASTSSANATLTAKVTEVSYSE